MVKRKTKIVIDSDIIIHFIKGGQLHILHNIFPAYECVILDVLYRDELCLNRNTQNYLINYQKIYPKGIIVIPFSPTVQMQKEYALLTRMYGKGESACMVYCKYNQDVLGSSNIRDIMSYCEMNSITYLTTMDFLWKAYISNILTEDDCNQFISQVLLKGSKLPVKEIKDFTPRAVL